MPWWQWVFGGIGATVAVWFFDRLIRHPNSSRQKSTITAQGASVSDSPIARGSGITQITGDTHYHHYPPAVVTPLPALDSAPKPKHNIKFIEAKSVGAHCGIDDGKIHESPQGLGDFQVSMVCFRNEPTIGKRILEPTIKSNIIYKGKNGEEITDVPRGVWLGELGETTVFESGKKECVIIFLLSNQNTLKKLWNERYHSETSWMAGGPVFEIRNEGIRGDVSSVEVRLLAHDTCVLSADFEVGSRIDGGLPALTLRNFYVA